MRKSVLALVAVVALSSSAFAFAGGSKMGAGMAQYGNMQGCTNSAGFSKASRGQGMGVMNLASLSDEQRHQLQILQSEMRLEMVKMQDPQRRAKMQAMMSADKFDAKEFAKAKQEMFEKRVDIQAKHMEKVFNLLTKEQRVELKNMMAQRGRFAPANAGAQK